MNILFLGSVYSPNIYNNCLVNKVKLDWAAYFLQKSLLQGFKENSCSIECIYVPTISYKDKLFVHPEEFEDEYTAYNHSLFTVNLPGVKQLFTPFVFRTSSFKLQYKPDIVFLYSVQSFSLKIASLLKRKYPQARVVLLVPDLPEFMSGSQNKVYRGMKAVEDKLVRKYSSVVDGYVLLAPRMKERLPIGNKPWCVIEGIYNSEITCNEVEKFPHKTILYTGNLGKRYGLIDLLNAFSEIKSNDYRLWICGDGDSLPEYLERQKIDSRIKYLGVLPREDILKLQKQATILINPRHRTDEYTKYSFPSKTMEYMASGTPVLMSRLECLPKEYLEHIYFFEDESVEGMRNAIEKICSKPQEELYQFGKEASKFIFEEKTPTMQVKHIIDFIKTIK